MSQTANTGSQAGMLTPMDSLPAWPESVSDWTNALASASWALLVGDSSTGQILTSSAATEGLLGRSAPRFLSDLVDDGILARPDYKVLNNIVGSPVDCAVSCTVQLHPLRRKSWAANIHVTSFTGLDQRPTFFCLIEAANKLEVPIETLSFTEPMVLICDENFIIRWIDPSLESIGINGDSQIGANALTTIHPSDLLTVLSKVRALKSGELNRAVVTVRVIGPRSLWSFVRLRIDRLVGERPAIMIQVRPGRSKREVLPELALSPRELVAVSGLFEGLRIRQLAERHGVSEKTIRNQLSSAYHKLDVSSQGDLLERYDPPLSLGRSVL